MWLSTPGANSILAISPLRLRWGGYARFAYAFLLAVVFPFICWGQSGQSGHPHPRSHFVFAAPPEFQPLVVHSDRMAGPYSHSLTSESSTFPVEDIAGQSTPATLALFSLLLVFAQYLWRLYRPVSQKHPHCLTIGSAQTTLAPRFPPPRVR